MAELSSNLLYAAFFLYLAATFLFAGSIKDKRTSTKNSKWGKIGFAAAVIGFAAQLGYFVTRWIASGHAPVSNLFEYTTFFGMMLVFAFIIIYLIYKNNVLGVFTMPVALIVIAFASMFPTEISPLIPALQSDWLKIHVTTAAFGEAILAISFGAGLIYLIKTVDQSHATKKTFWLEFILYALVATVAFVAFGSGFKAAGYETVFQAPVENGQPQEIIYNFPAIAGPADGEITGGAKFGPLFEAPSWMEGENAARKLNTLLWSLLGGLFIYGVLRLLLRKRVAAALHPLVKNVNPKLVDEISYRAVTIGFPVFTLGALIFAMIWAQVAWTRFWGWDPKEVWALVTWLFYAAFLHLRLSRGWEGEKSAWLAVIGFAIIMFNLVAVNLVIAGLHSYA